MKKNLLKNKKGQGLVEYLIIVAIIAVGSMAVIKTVGGNMDVQFARIANILAGRPPGGEVHEVTESMYKKRDFGSFFDGADSGSKSNNKKD